MRHFFSEFRVVLTHLPSQSAPTILTFKTCVSLQPEKKIGSGFFFVIQKEKRQPGLSSFKLQIASGKNMVQTLKKIELMQPYIF